MLTYSMEKRENTGKTEFLARSIREDILGYRSARWKMPTSCWRTRGSFPRRPEADFM